MTEMKNTTDLYAEDTRPVQAKDLAPFAAAMEKLGQRVTAMESRELERDMKDALKRDLTAADDGADVGLSDSLEYGDQPRRQDWALQEAQNRVRDYRKIIDAFIAIAGGEGEPGAIYDVTSAPVHTSLQALRQLKANHDSLVAAQHEAQPLAEALLEIIGGRRVVLDPEMAEKVRKIAHA